MKSGVTVVKNKLGQVSAGIHALTAKHVLVGIPASKAARGSAINNAALLYIHDNGAPEANIPARPVVAPGLADCRAAVEQRLVAAGKAALQGRPEAVEKGLNAVGLVASNAIKVRINSNTPPPLKESTLAARRRRGVTRTNTLVDTAQMRNAVTYVIREAKK